MSLFSNGRTPLKQLHNNENNIDVSPDADEISSITKPMKKFQSPWKSNTKAIPMTHMNSTDYSHTCSSVNSNRNHLYEQKDIIFQLQIREEKERQYKNQITMYESQISILENKYRDSMTELQTCKDDVYRIQLEKDTLACEVRRLTRAQINTAPTSDNSSMPQSMWSQMTAASRELTRVEQESLQLKRECTQLQEQNSQLLRQIQLHSEKEETWKNTITEYQAERENSQNILRDLENVMSDNVKLNMTISDLSDELVIAKSEYDKTISKLHQDIDILMKENERLQNENTALLSNPIPATCTTICQVEPETKLVEEKLYLDKIADLQNRLFHSELKRRKTHNQLQDLKGSVRVYVRCRPFLSSDNTAIDQEESCIQCNVDGTTISLSDACARGSGSIFQFDGVFNQKSTQEQVFTEVSDFVQSALDGYCVCIFSYGQTGSGKTHTMTGDPHQREERGIIPRATEHVISNIVEMRKVGWEVSVTCSMVEVYNESLVDLLVPPSSNDNDDVKLKITMINDRVVVMNLTSLDIPCSTVASGLNQLDSMLAQAAKARTTAATAMNERSSRSHVMFMMNIKATHTDGTVVQGGLRLVDLAGSERLDRTGTLNDAARLRETVNINKSLSCLGDVFLALGNKASHVPYRNSKLTMLLQVRISFILSMYMLIYVNIIYRIAYQEKGKL
jgi:kinesin family protein C1